MSFKENLSLLLNFKDIKVDDLALQIKYARSTIYFWLSGKKTPNADALICLSKFFNVSVDYLLGIEDDFGVKQFTGNADTVSPEEFLLLKKFRALNLSTQEAFRIQINAMYEKEVKGEKV